MDPIKDAFAKVKLEILELKEQIEEIKRTILAQQTNQQTDKHIIPTNQQINPTINPNPTDNYPLQALKTQDIPLSTGTRGVPTDRQSDSQTDRQTQNNTFDPLISNEGNIKITPNFIQNIHLPSKTDKITQIEHVSALLESLDSLKKEIRSNFKHLTQQEMAVFSAIYELENQGFVVDYPLLAQKLALSESSIRDYAHKIIKKGIPLLKSKENNKKVILSVSSELKKIASLQTILALREI